LENVFPSDLPVQSSVAIFPVYFRLERISVVRKLKHFKEKAIRTPVDGEREGEGEREEKTDFKCLIIFPTLCFPNENFFSTEESSARNFFFKINKISFSFFP
jgi:hypothetical protein